MFVNVQHPGESTTYRNKLARSLGQARRELREVSLDAGEDSRGS